MVRRGLPWRQRRYDSQERLRLPVDRRSSVIVSSSSFVLHWNRRMLHKQVKQLGREQCGMAVAARTSLASAAWILTAFTQRLAYDWQPSTHGPTCKSRNSGKKHGRRRWLLDQRGQTEA